MVARRISTGHFASLGVLVIMGFLPLVVQGSPRILNLMSIMLIWAVVASAWDLSMGYANVWSFGHIAFFAVGGYTTAMSVLYTGVPPALAMPLGGLMAAFIGVLIGLPCLRLHGVYIAMVTFAIHLILPTLILWQSKYTGGDSGLFGFPRVEIGQFTFSSNMPVFGYYVMLGLAACLLFAIYRVIRSASGLAFIALRDSEAHAKSLGVSDYKYRLIVFGVSAGIAGFCGGMYTSFYGSISPKMLDIGTFLMILVMLMLGGLGRFPGAVAGAFVITILSEVLRPLYYLRFVVLGAIVVLVMLAMPQGLMGFSDILRHRGGQMLRRTVGKRGRLSGEGDEDTTGASDGLGSL